MEAPVPHALRQGPGGRPEAPGQARELPRALGRGPLGERP